MSKLKVIGLMMMATVVAAGAAVVWGQSRTQDVEVGIAARSVEDGRIELAIEYDGERVLPSRRYMTAGQINARNNSWLRSTPVTVQAQIESSADASEDGLAETRTTTATDAGWVSAVDLERATYLTESTDGGVATLESGEFRAPAAPGSAAELVIQLGSWAAGDLDGQGGEDAAAITVERPGGSGAFYYIHALTAGEDGLRDVGAVFLGDRIRIEEVAIHNGTITVVLRDRAPSAAMSSEPDVAVLRRFAVEGGALVELDDGRVSAAELERATYLTESTDTGVATLESGEFRAPAAPDSAAELVIQLGKWAAGDLDGRGGEDAAAVTVEQPGGSGTFYFVHALVAGEDGLRDAGAVLLGDRIRVEGVSIHDGVITVALLDRAPDAAMASEPTVAVIRRFALEDGALAEQNAAE